MEINLDDLIRQPEHDCVLGPHPLLDVNDLFDFFWHVFISCEGDLLKKKRGFLMLFQVAPEVLQKRYFFLEVLRVDA